MSMGRHSRIQSVQISLLGFDWNNFKRKSSWQHKHNWFLSSQVEVLIPLGDVSLARPRRKTSYPRIKSRASSVLVSNWQHPCRSLQRVPYGFTHPTQAAGTRLVTFTRGTRTCTLLASTEVMDLQAENYVS